MPHPIPRYRRRPWLLALLLAALAHGAVAQTKPPNQGGTLTAIGAAFNRALLEEDFDRAESLARERLRLSLETGRNRAIGNAYRNLGSVLTKQGKLVEAELATRQALPMVEKAHGRISRPVVHAQQNLISLLVRQNRYGEAMRLIDDALVRMQQLGPDRVGMLDLWNVQAKVLRQLGQPAQALAILDKAAAYPVVAAPIDPDDNRSGEAWVARARRETQYQRGLCLRGLGRLDESRQALSATLAANLAAQPLRPGDIISTQTALADVWQRQGKPEQALPLLQAAYQLGNRHFGAANPITADAATNLARGLLLAGQARAAEPLLQQALPQHERLGSQASYIDTADLLLQLQQQDGRQQQALTQAYKGLDAIDKLFVQTRGLDDGLREGFIQRYGPFYIRTLNLLAALHASQPQQGYDRQMLAVVSRTQSRLFSELMRQADAGRLSAEPGYQALLQRQAQARGRLQALRLQLANTGGLDEVDADDDEAATAPPDTTAAPPSRVQALQALLAVQTELDSVQQQLWASYPRIMDLAQPRAVTVDELQQRVLRDNEALLSYALLPDRTLAFVVGRDRFQLFNLPLGRDAVGKLVGAIRQPEEAGGDSLAALRQLDPALLHQAYRQLIQPLESALPAGGRVLVVGDGALHTLPLEMLVTRWDDADRQAFAVARTQGPLLGEFGTLPYLQARYHFAYLPSLSTLVSKRLYQPAPPAYTTSLVTFADPQFELTQPAGGSWLDTVLSRSYRKAKQNIEIPRLPETAQEARSIAALLGGRSRVYLAQDAQEYTLKQLDLSHTRYLHFATHGLLGGEFAAVKTALDGAEAAAVQRPQPALLLSLSGELRGEDGLLTMGEVAEQLRLSAQLVVLSACNTAGEQQAAGSGEGFAGLARAFMYAGAHGLLVSHWAVESQATQELMVSTFAQLQQGQESARAIEAARDALRTSQWQQQGVAMSRAHPFFWAPFVYVGD